LLHLSWNYIMYFKHVSTIIWLIIYNTNSFVSEAYYVDSGASPRRGLGWTCPPYFCQRPFLRLMQIRRVFWGWGVGDSRRTRTAAVNVSFCNAPPFTCLLFTNDPIRIWSRYVRKWSLFSIHAGLLTVIRKRLQSKKFTSSIHSKHYFWLTGGFRKYHTKVAYFAPRLGGPTAECFQLQEAAPPDPRYRLALRAHHESYSRLLSTPLLSTWRRPCVD